MSISLNADDIISQLKKLDKEDQLNVFQQFKLILAEKDNDDKSFFLTSLAGLGSEIFKDTDIDNFIDEERQW